MAFIGDPRFGESRETMDVGKMVTEAYGSGRLEILRLLKTGTLRYTDLVARSQISEGEVSRHLQRLQLAGLVEKQMVGGFLLTPLARAVLRFDAGLDTLARHGEHFRLHDLHALDEQSLLNLEALASADFATDPLVCFDALHDVFKSVRTRFDSICLIADHVARPGADSNALRPLAESLQRQKPKVRMVLQQEDSELGVRVHYPMATDIAYRTTTVCRIDLSMSDSMALVAFSQRDGRLDYNGAFFGSDPRFLEWVGRYFEHVWSNAQPLPLPQVAVLAKRTGPLVPCAGPN